MKGPTWLDRTKNKETGTTILNTVDERRDNTVREDLIQ